VHPLTVADVDGMVRAGILDEDDRVELLDGVLVEMSPQSERHAYAIRRLTLLAAQAAVRNGLELNIQLPLNVESAISQPEPDVALTPSVARGAHASRALLVVEVSRSSRRLDLGRKAEIYAEAGIPEYWVLDVEHGELVVHRDPREGRYSSVHTLGADETVAAVALDLTVPVCALL
jgi:Uma2 family endonuclease